MAKRILAFSSSRTGSSGYLETALPSIKNFLGNKPLHIVFIPFASLDKDYESYTHNVRTALHSLSHNITTVKQDDTKNSIEQSDAIMVGGGNTFKLLHDIYDSNILNCIYNKVSSGTPYIGWSAGSNILCPTIATTNDMPIIEPRSFNALGLLPFQINPHYINEIPSGYHGETRNQRLEEFMKMNPGMSVIGLPEGTALRLEDEPLQFIGPHKGVLLYKEENSTYKEIVDGDDLSFLL
jgi:dipeptidase E